MTTNAYDAEDIFMAGAFGENQSAQSVDYAAAAQAYAGQLSRIDAAYADMQATKRADQCSKCNGTGFINKYHYVENGRCFACN
jgi:hypothetical protein